MANQATRRTLLAMFGAWASQAGCSMLGPWSPTAPLERALIFHPPEFPEELWEREKPEIEDAWFQASDGTRLHGLFLDHPQPRAIALFCHGNAENVASCALGLQVLVHRHEMAVLAFDYRGYGRSEGRPSEKGILLDARAAHTWLAERKRISPDQIVLMGRSLGGAVAVDLASQGSPRALVLASTFTSLPEVASAHVPWLMPQMLMTQRLNSLAKIRRYQGPLLQSHGEKDRLIPIEQARELFAAAPGPKQFVEIPGAGHNDPVDENYRQIFEQFIDALPPVAS